MPCKRKRRKKTSNPELWIQKAIKKEGALTATVKRKYGKRGFTQRGTIKVEVLRKLAKKPRKTGKRARLALTLRELH